MQLAARELVRRADAHRRLDALHRLDVVGEFGVHALGADHTDHGPFDADDRVAGHAGLLDAFHHIFELLPGVPGLHDYHHRCASSAPVGGLIVVGPLSRRPRRGDEAAVRRWRGRRGGHRSWPVDDGGEESVAT